MVAPANSRFLTELSARFGMTRFDGACGTMKSCPSRSCGSQNPQKDGAVDLNAPRGLKPAVLLATVDAGLEGLLHPCF